MAEWYVRVDGKVHGPMDSAKLKRLAESGRISEETEVSQSKSGPFVPAAKVNGLFAQRSRPIPPPASPPSLPPAPAAQSHGGSSSRDNAPRERRATGYIAKSLLPGERVVYQGRLHWFIFLRPVALAVLGFMIPYIVLGEASDDQQNAKDGATILGVFLCLAAVCSLVMRIITYVTSEFVVTDKRVVLKQGFIRRKTLELMLNKVDSLGVTQGIFGRIFNFGAIQVTVASEKQQFVFLSNPLEFRRQVQALQAHSSA